VVLIDISERGNPRFWTEELQRRILARLLNVLYVRASQTINATQGVNVLVLLDEAHRHAPSGHLESGSQAEVLRSVLRRAVRETRKYGVGWFLISQTLGGIDNEILQQLRILFFGFGLALGDEFRKLGEYAGETRGPWNSTSRSEIPTVLHGGT
jgi:DNA helicase HerA-like ATPase